MKKIILSACFIACVSFGLFNQAIAEQKVAVVDIQKVVTSSTQLLELNKEQEAKIQELEKWIAVVKQDVDKQQTQEGKEKLLNKYRTTYNQKKDAIIKDGQTKMQAAMNSITLSIETEAKAKGYDMVITKNVVVYGGEDITEDIIKAINTKPQKTIIKSDKKQQAKR